MSNQDQPVVFVPPGSPVWVPGDVNKNPTGVNEVQSPPPPEPESRVPEMAAVVLEDEERHTDERSARNEQKERKSQKADKKSKSKAKKEKELKSSARPTPEMVAVAERALDQWNLDVSKMVVAAAKPERGAAIWRLQTSDGPKGLKLLHRSPARSMFSVAAQDYLVQRGAKVPALVRTRDGSLYTILSGQMLIMTDWIEDLVPAPKDAEGAAALCYGLGEFHRLSRGFYPPPEAKFATRLHRWPNSYAKMRAKFDWFEELARAYKDQPASGTLLKAAQLFKQQAEEAIERLENSAYYRMVALGEPHWGLAHQDYGWGNGQLGPGGVWVIDLDGVRYDIPIRDLRKMISNAMIDLGTWDMSWIEPMIAAYQESNPMDGDVLELLLIDLSFPNEGYKVARSVVYNPDMMNEQLDMELKAVLAAEESKWKALRALGLRGR